MKVVLKHVDLSKRTGCEHPDLNGDAFYLAKFNGRWVAGQFSLQRWGWNFDAVYGAGCQLDYPGWEALYEIIESE